MTAVSKLSVYAGAKKTTVNVLEDHVIGTNATLEVHVTECVA